MRRTVRAPQWLVLFSLELFAAHTTVSFAQGMPGMGMGMGGMVTEEDTARCPQSVVY